MRRVHGVAGDACRGAADAARRLATSPGSPRNQRCGAECCELSRFEGDRRQPLGAERANAGGRPVEPLLIGESYRTGRYEVLLHLDDWFAQMGARLPQPSFLAKVPLRFTMFDTRQHYHVPMLCTPWSCSTYRGS